MFDRALSFRHAQSAPGRGVQQGDTHAELERSAARAGRLLCAACRAFVTESSARLEVNSAHSHAFVNAVGVIYRIGCFASAPGTRPLGEESTHWTWFPGFAWQVAICRTCSEHLGWGFRSVDSQFFGLILERLVECREPWQRPS
jgi:hypothetical protein